MVPIWLDIANKIAGIFLPFILGAGTIYFAVKRYRFDRENLRYQRDSDVLKWAQEVLKEISEIEMVVSARDKGVFDENELKKTIFRSRCKLSTLVDYGRMLFPNKLEDKYGVNKESAFKGYRHQVLDCLVEIYDLSFRGRTTIKDIVDLRRIFISDIQDEIDPRRRIRFLSAESYAPKKA